MEALNTSLSRCKQPNGSSFIKINNIKNAGGKSALEKLFMQEKLNKARCFGGGRGRKRDFSQPVFVLVECTPPRHACQRQCLLQDLLLQTAVSQPASECLISARGLLEGQRELALVTQQVCFPGQASSLQELMELLPVLVTGSLCSLPPCPKVSRICHHGINCALPYSR